MVHTWFPAEHQAGRNFVELRRKNPNDNHEKLSLSVNPFLLACIWQVPYSEPELEDKPQITVPTLCLKGECFHVNNGIFHTYQYMYLCTYSM